MTSQPTPPGWGNDPLTRYLDDARGNQFAAFANKRSEVIDLIAIDGMFRKLLEGAVNPRPFVPMGFLLRAHSAYLSAVGAVMAGQAYEAQALLRVCLEQGAYWECKPEIDLRAWAVCPISEVLDLSEMLEVTRARTRRADIIAA